MAMEGQCGAVWVQHDPVHNEHTIKGLICIPQGQGRGSAAAPCSGCLISMNAVRVQDLQHRGRGTPGFWTESFMQGYLPFSPWMQDTGNLDNPLDYH